MVKINRLFFCELEDEPNWSGGSHGGVVKTLKPTDRVILYRTGRKEPPNTALAAAERIKKSQRGETVDVMQLNDGQIAADMKERIVQCGNPSLSVYLLTTLKQFSPLVGEGSSGYCKSVTLTDRLTGNHARPPAVEKEYQDKKAEPGGGDLTPGPGGTAVTDTAGRADKTGPPSDTGEAGTVQTGPQLPGQKETAKGPRNKSRDGSKKNRGRGNAAQGTQAGNTAGQPGPNPSEPAGTEEKGAEAGAKQEKGRAGTRAGASTPEPGNMLGQEEDKTISPGPAEGGQAPKKKKNDELPIRDVGFIPFGADMYPGITGDAGPQGAELSSAPSGGGRTPGEGDMPANPRGNETASPRGGGCMGRQGAGGADKPGCNLKTGKDEKPQGGKQKGDGKAKPAGPDPTMEDLYRVIWGNRRRDSPLEEKQYTDLDDAKAQTTALLEERLVVNIDKLIPGFKNMEAGREIYLELISTLISSEDYEDFQYGWDVVQPQYRLPGMDEEIYGMLHEEAEYYARACEILYADDHW